MKFGRKIKRKRTWSSNSQVLLLYPYSYILTAKCLCYIYLDNWLGVPDFLFSFLLPNKVMRRNTLSNRLAYFLCEAKFTELMQLAPSPIVLFLLLLSDLVSNPHDGSIIFCVLIKFGSAFVVTMFCSWRLFFKVMSSCSRFWILKLVDSYSVVENLKFCITRSFCSRKPKGLVPVPRSGPSVYGLSTRFWLAEYGHWLEFGMLPDNSPHCAYLNESEHSLNTLCVLSCWTKRAWTISLRGINSFWTASMHASCDNLWQSRYLHTAPLSSWDILGCVYSKKENDLWTSEHQHSVDTQ